MSDHTDSYWGYEYQVAARYLVPLLRAWGVEVAGATVLDVGCAEGGGLCALHDAGARCVGFDIDASRIADALRLRGERPVEFRTGDMYAGDLPFGDRTFDLVTLHDVFEHLDRKSAMMAKLAAFLAPHGRLLITFPPYFSAYGAHQQHLRTRFARLPFIHLMPGATSKMLPRLEGEAPHIVEEIGKLARLRMGMRAFERLARASDLRIERRKAYLIGPNHIRFRLPVLGAGPLGMVPFVREVVCTGVIYLLGRE